MRNSILIMAIMLLSLVFVCFNSVPVFSAEDPWDVDNGNGNSGDSGSDTDSTESGSELEVVFFVSGGDDFSLDWFTEFVFQLSYVIATYCVDADNQQSDVSVITTEKTEVDSAIR